MPKDPAIYFRCSAEFRDRFLATARLRGTSGQEILQQFAAQWLDGEPAPAPEPASRAGPNEALHRDLDLILSDPEERPGIEANLRWGAETVRRKARGKHKKAG